ncbi:hypothetical protein B0T26DRAFT_670882 [Lasiosphaeria miniovina]|uniref:Uncharacterized protein n=1 Tax=Lasiosphaeria miniovina TaxID=1954250 RepID=A0AA40BI18_9PEZI|nr:uncharacterized protein B0T26DRAFT_670882 [Lasiosphaeria miniovina]KAK0734607.1 hypothetical protein B0T26DRAFT_670882 [Lasiosphaeria miniovina]
MVQEIADMSKDWNEAPQANLQGHRNPCRPVDAAQAKYSEACVVASYQTIQLVQRAREARYLSQRNPFVVYFLFVASLNVFMNQFASIYHTDAYKKTAMDAISIMKYCAQHDPEASKALEIMNRFSEVVTAGNGTGRLVVSSSSLPPCLSKIRARLFAAFGDIFGLDPDLTELASFVSFDARRMEAILLQSGAILGSETPVDFDVLLGERLLLQHIPIGALDEVCKVLQTELVHNIGYGKLNEIRLTISILHREVPSLKDGGVDMLVLICTSREGESFYQHTLERMLESRSPELKVLLLRGRAGLNEQAVWERIALSFERVMGDGCHPAIRYYLYND